MAKRPTKSRRPQTEAERAREEHWRGILSEQQRSGQSITAFCREKEISANAFFWWRREVRLRDQGQGRRTAKRSKERRSLVPVRISEAALIDGGLTAGSFEVVLRSRRVVRVPVGFDAESLRKLIAMLEDGAC